MLIATEFQKLLTISATSCTCISKVWVHLSKAELESPCWRNQEENLLGCPGLNLPFVIQLLKLQDILFLCTQIKSIIHNAIKKGQQRLQPLSKEERLDQIWKEEQFNHCYRYHLKYIYIYIPHSVKHATLKDITSWSFSR